MSYSRLAGNLSNTTIWLCLGVCLLAVMCAGALDGKECSQQCEEQYGAAYQARMTRTKYDSTCDCIGPDGTVKAPRR